MATNNTPWQLEEFVDSLVVELHKTRDTLAVRAVNDPLSYTVKELALDLKIFPSYDGEQVKFITAGPGQDGASNVKIELASITDQQVRATTKTPGGKNDIAIDETGLDRKTKKQLRKLGVKSVDDLKEIERKNIDLKKVAATDIDYVKLANEIQKSRRSRMPPVVRSASLVKDDNNNPCLVVEGENLAIDPSFPPVAVVNKTLVPVKSSSGTQVAIQLTGEHLLSASNELILACDPFAVMKVNVTI